MITALQDDVSRTVAIIEKSTEKAENAASRANAALEKMKEYEAQYIYESCPNLIEQLNS